MDCFEAGFFNLQDGYAARTKEEHYRINNKGLPSNDMTPLEIQLHIEKQRERRFDEAEELLKAEEEEMSADMKEGDYTIMVSIADPLQCDDF